MSEPPPKADGEYRIVVNSIQLSAGLPPLVKPVIHNELVFYHGNTPVAAFNGDPMNRTTGDFVYPSLSNQDTLRVSITENSTRANDPRNPYPQVASGVVFSGGRDEFIQHLHQATQAAHSINNANIDYIMLSAGFAPQNSNSVVGSLLQAMDLKPPESTAPYWAPGEGRSLLPNNFAQTVPAINPQDPSHIQQLVGRLEALREQAVQERVRQDPNPYANGSQNDCLRAGGDGLDCSRLQAAGQLFDPNKPTAVAPNEPERQTPQRPATGAPSGP